MTTPQLVRQYRDWHVLGSQRRLTDREAQLLSDVVDELRQRGVLD